MIVKDGIEQLKPRCGSNLLSWVIPNISVLILPKILKQYNNTKHSTIKMTPEKASKKRNESTVCFNLYGDMEQLSSKPKFKVGDKVRIIFFTKAILRPNWTEEIFLVNKIQSLTG